MSARFADRLTSPLPGLRDFIRIMREGGFSGGNHQERDADKVPRVAPPRPLPELEPDEASLTWIGHATYLIRLAGLNILSDPIYSQRLPNRAPRMVPPGVPFDALPTIDAVIVSHNHYDHLDSATIKRLAKRNPDMVAFVPLGLARFFHRRGVRNVQELDWWQDGDLGGLRFTCVPVHHWSGRLGFDNNRTLWSGWVLEGAGLRLFFGGDTGYGGRFKEVGVRFDGFDAAMMPIGAYAPRYFMQHVHMDPEEAVKACDDLGARRLASMHWGTFILTQEPLLEPLEGVRKAWNALGRPKDDLWDLAVGETRMLQAARLTASKGAVKVQRTGKVPEAA